MEISCYYNNNTDDIEAAHRLAPRSDGKPAAMIVRFQRRDRKQSVLSRRRNLKGSGQSISEDLTHLNFKLLNRIQNHEQVESCWASNGKILGRVTGIQKKIQFRLFETVEETIARVSNATKK